MVIIKLEIGELETILANLAAQRGISIDMLVSEIVNKYFPAPHSIDQEKMAQGYKEMGDLNLSIANGDNDKKG